VGNVSQYGERVVLRGRDGQGQMKVRMTLQSALLGIVLFIVLALKSWAKVSSGKWSETVGFAVAVVGAALGLAIAFTAKVPSDSLSDSHNTETLAPIAGRSPRQFRIVILQWLVLVLVFLLVFQILDALKVNWRQFLN
jgi:hypothetical protein